MKRPSAKFSPTAFSRYIAPVVLAILVLGLLATIAITVLASLGVF
jgi:hypothetical protein